MLTRSDKWTRLSAVGHGFFSAASIFKLAVYSSNLIQDWVNGTQPDSLEKIPDNTTLYVGCILMTFATGALYSQMALNAFHERQAVHNILRSPILVRPSTEHSPHAEFTSGDEGEDYGNGNAYDYRQTFLRTTPTSHLTIIQKMALGAEFAAEAGAISNALIAGTVLFKQLVLKQSLTLIGNIPLAIGSTIFGALGAIANVRNCKHAMSDGTEGNLLEHFKADRLTNIAAVGESLVSALNIFSWVANWAELIMELASGTQKNTDTMSDLSLYLGCAFMLLSLGAFYSHRKLNAYHQYRELQDPEGMPLSCLQKTALGAEAISHTAKISNAITTGADLLGKTVLPGVLPSWGKLLLKCSATVFAAASAAAPVRNCEDAIHSQNTDTYLNSRRTGSSVN
ncbi:MAG TPA: hypothetical protein VLI69_05830 [Gammaproteobacteria bacterium]|nr:hypothetical protein [Gammaproteobacteria bacterium]